MRRRQRRLRQWLRHERLSVAMALAETSHHSAPRGQTKARAGVRPGVFEDPEPRRETEHDQHAALRGLKPPSPGVPSQATPLLAGQAMEELEGRGGEGGEGEGEGGAEEAAEAAGTGTRVLGAYGHPFRAPLGPAGCQAQRAFGA